MVGLFGLTLGVVQVLYALSLAIVMGLPVDNREGLVPLFQSPS